MNVGTLANILHGVQEWVWAYQGLYFDRCNLYEAVETEGSGEVRYFLGDAYLTVL